MAPGVRQIKNTIKTPEHNGKVERFHRTVEEECLWRIISQNKESDEDKYRQRKYGEPRYHVYYHCSRQVDHKCSERYINEEGLVKAFFRYINFTYIAHPQLLNLTKDIRNGMREYKQIRDDVLLRQDIDPDSKTTDVRDYARHVLSNGDAEKKRQLIQLFSEQLYLHDRKITSSRVKKTAE